MHEYLHTHRCGAYISGRGASLGEALKVNLQDSCEEPLSGAGCPQSPWEGRGSDRKSALDLPPPGLQPRALPAALDQAQGLLLTAPHPPHRRALPSTLPPAHPECKSFWPSLPSPPTPASMDLLFRKHLFPSSPLTHASISGVLAAHTHSLPREADTGSWPGAGLEWQGAGRPGILTWGVVGVGAGCQALVHAGASWLRTDG